MSLFLFVMIFSFDFFVLNPFLGYRHPDLQIHQAQEDLVLGRFLLAVVLIVAAGVPRIIDAKFLPGDLLDYWLLAIQAKASFFGLFRHENAAPGQFVWPGLENPVEMRICIPGGCFGLALIPPAPSRTGPGIP